MDKINEERMLYAKSNRDVFEEAILNLPECQQICVRACFDVANKAPSQRRHALECIYECLLMHIKSSRLYEHMRDIKILILPSRPTLQKYIQQIGTVYGFQQSLFDFLKLKASRMEVDKKHGT